MRAATTVRVGMGGLGAVHAWWGAWARLAPQDFFENFPGLGRRWTAAYPPYNEHLVTDLGATFLALAFLLGVGAALRDRPPVPGVPQRSSRSEEQGAGTAMTVRTVALAAVGIFSALHLTFHAANPGSMTGSDLTASLASLILGVLVPAGLLALDRVTGPAWRGPRPDDPR